MFDFITAWAVCTLSCWAAATLLPGVSIPSPKDSIVIAAVLGAVCAALAYIVILMFGIESPELTGLEIFVMRSIVVGLMFTILGERLQPRVVFSNRLSALGCAVLMSGLSTGLQYLMK